MSVRKEKGVGGIVCPLHLGYIPEYIDVSGAVGI